LVRPKAGSASRSNVVRRFSGQAPIAYSCRACVTHRPFARSSKAEAAGVARVSVGSGPHRATLALTREIARELKTKGTYTSFTRDAITHDETNELMR
jgi:2-methylisocitrate lyase-like PEP mutase family enzyme